MTIVESNKLIASFMDNPLVYDGVGDRDKLSSYIDKKFNVHYYNSSWDWLMPVVDKIETIQLPSPAVVKVRVEIGRNSCVIFKGEFHDDMDGFISCVDYDDSGQTKLEATYKCVVDFIQWYNKNKQS